MVRALIFLLLFLGLHNEAHALFSLNGVGTVNVCGQTLSTAGLIHLYCKVSGANNRCNFRLASDQSSGASISSGYTPSSNKKFMVDVIHIVVSSGNSGSFIELGYSDNDLGFASGSTWTNGVMAAGQSQGTNGAIPIASISATSGNSTQDPNLGFCVPAVNFLMPNGKYLGLKGDGTAVFFGDVYGHEQ